MMQDEHNNARIADIGLSKVLAGQDVQASPGTTLWASPEQIQVTACCQSALCLHSPNSTSMPLHLCAELPATGTP